MKNYANHMLAKVLSYTSVNEGDVRTRWRSAPIDC